MSLTVVNPSTIFSEWSSKPSRAMYQVGTTWLIDLNAP
jgi:hypothetical protein